MKNHVCSRLLASALVLPTALVAQGGTAVWSIHGSVPDSLAAMMPGELSSFDLTFTMATDGQNASFILAAGPEMVASNLDVDLSAFQVQVLARKGVDSISIGVTMPPNLAAIFGGDIGVRLDMPIPDSLPLPVAFDSIESTDTLPEVVNTGRTDIVAGLKCEVWTLTSTESPDTPLEFCFTSGKPAVFSALEAVVSKNYSQFIEALKRRSGAAANPFGNREMFPIRVRMGGAREFTFELTSVSNVIPPASYFQLPADLKVLEPDWAEGFLNGMGSTGT